MTQKMNSLKSGWLTLLILAILLAVLFNQSLKPGWVVNSNDSPLGALNTESGSLPETFLGYWNDLNWVGEERPSATPNFTMALAMVLNNPVLYSKIYAPVSLLLLGFAGWLLLRQLGFTSVVCILGAIAFSLNMNSFSNACWGMSPRALTMGSTLLALAALHMNPARFPALKYGLAGWAVGLGIMEGYDVGALFSLIVAAYATFQIVTEKGPIGRKFLKAAGLVAVIAVSAALFSFQTLTSLVGTQIHGVEGMQQDSETKRQRWEQATQWSLPINETLRVAVPGLFGYRMSDIDHQLQNSSYWGAVGRTHGWETHKQGLPRHSGSGEYAGALVLILALFAVLQSFRKKSLLTRQAKLAIRFWSGIAFITLILAFGWHTPVYRLVYELPYFSTIRNPIKFMHLFHLALLILFGYGLQTLWTAYLKKTPKKTDDFKKTFNLWWSKAPVFDRRWLWGSVALLGFGSLAFLIYASAERDMRRFLVDEAIPPNMVQAIFTFSKTEILWALFFFASALSLVTLVMSGIISIRQQTVLGISLGFMLIFDLGRANQYWIIHYDYQNKYLTNPVIEKLRSDSHLHRVTADLNPFAPGSLTDANGTNLRAIANFWKENLFQWFNIHSLDVVQMPRPQILDVTYGRRFALNNPQDLSPLFRLWKLTSTRYLLGMSHFVSELNLRSDPERNPFSIVFRFNIEHKPGAKPNSARIEDFQLVEQSNGPFCLMEFRETLPKVKRFDNWVVAADDPTGLEILADPTFDPDSSVVVMGTELQPPSDTDSNQSFDSVVIRHYDPRVITLETQGSRPGIVLLNDRYHPNWKVYVDGEPSPLLRCNYLMRGVLVSEGSHMIKFRYQPPHIAQIVSFLAIGVGCTIVIILIVFKRKSRS